ncbi:MAG: D-glycero-beta-D-manno-heptose-1,7-bisphosphate 7-phosphatase [Gammaproteobacteria bacterium]|nr:D-glycero-beta-D-manno-heptose-1,7-bisphosphate 7-phosphatase [Gammaproteobacteria bacterium]MBK79422.1 D-glycero-beta-D-manno-heptose-1,7-bisphosphate 7-phosphatase [Gammaproteobacteria bacterium]
MARLILLDRDGVLNVDSPDFVRSADEWLPIPGALPAVAALNRAGLLVGVCTNQSGVGRGLFSEATLTDIHRRMRTELDAAGGHLDDLRYCPHDPDAGCDCRKPAPGMLRAAMAALDVSPDETIFVGDAIRDVEAAHAAGCRAALVRTGKGAQVEPLARGMGVSWIGDDLAAFVEWILRERSSCR